MCNLLCVALQCMQAMHMLSGMHYLFACMHTLHSCIRCVIFAWSVTRVWPAKVRLFVDGYTIDGRYSFSACRDCCSMPVLQQSRELLACIRNWRDTRCEFCFYIWCILWYVLLVSTIYLTVKHVTLKKGDEITPLVACMVTNCNLTCCSLKDYIVHKK